MNWEFVSPWAFVILPLPLVIWRFSTPKRVRMDAVLLPFFREITEAAGLEAKPGAVILRRRRVQILVATLCWILTVIGLARPELLGQQITMEKSARDLMLAVDISASMRTDDMLDKDGVKNQRLDIVKNVVDGFIDDREDDRIGLIVFGSRAYIQSPFTEDHRSVQQLLKRTHVEMAGPYTAIGDTIGLAINAFEASELDQRLMILLSDGSDTSSMMSPPNAAEIAVQNGVTIHTVGVGNPEGGGNQQVDLELLKEIAERTGGLQFFADDEEGLSAIYDEIDALSPRVTESVSFQPTKPVSWVAFALAAFLAFSLLLWLAASRRAN